MCLSVKCEYVWKHEHLSVGIQSMCVCEWMRKCLYVSKSECENVGMSVCVNIGESVSANVDMDEHVYVCWYVSETVGMS